MPVDNVSDRMIEQIKRLAEKIDESTRLVVLTGAGVSTDSGIPDFRSQSGTYSRWDSSRVFDIDYFHRDPEYFFNYAREELYNFDAIEPNPVHYFLAELEKSGKLKAVITQNIDMLHQRAGSRTVYELHGSIQDAHCLKCGKYYEYNTMHELVFREAVPVCACGGIIKPDIVFFGESLPEMAINAAYNISSQTDLFITMGTSLVVYPAASLPVIAKENGAQLIIINREATPMDRAADFIVQAELRDIVHQISQF